MEFSLSPELLDLKERTRKFVDEVVIPAEKRMPEHADEGFELRDELQFAAKQAGVPRVS